MSFFSKKAKDGVHAPQHLLGDKAAHTLFAESYRTLRTNIHLVSVKQDVSSILVTSAAAQEGKSTVAANIGWTIARQGKSVVLVDCDFRRPCLSKAVDSSFSIGLTGLTADVIGGEINETSKNKECGIADILTLIELQQRTGKLLVRNAAGAVELFFLRGKAADVAWFNCPQHLSLPFLLHSEGGLSKEQAELVLKRQQSDSGHQLCDMISSIGFADEARLKGAAVLHVAEVLRQLHVMENPSFYFTALPEQQLDARAAVLAELPQQIARIVFSRNELPYIDNCIRQAIVQADDGLAILPLGPIPPNPSELASSARLLFLLSRLKHLYDFVIIDTPPVLPVSDALLLAPHADGIIMTARAGWLNRVLIGKALEQLREANANVLGLVLNQVDIKREGYYHYHQKYASGYYGVRRKA